jgi:hypothetical protein
VSVPHIDVYQVAAVTFHHSDVAPERPEQWTAQSARSTRVRLRALPDRQASVRCAGGRRARGH